MKKKYLAILIGLLVVSIVSAGVINYFGTKITTVDATQSIKLNGNNWNIPSIEAFGIIYNGWEQKETGDVNIISNDADRDLKTQLTDECCDSSNNCGYATGEGCEGITISLDTIGLSTTWSSNADASADVSLANNIVTLIANEHAVDWSDASEARITIDAEDIETLLELDSDLILDDIATISWDVDVNSGYIAHIDVLIDINNDGDADDALVFEAAKVDPSNCELVVGPYPIGDGIDTLGRGIVQDSAYAWLSSGAPGPGCVAVDTFYTNTLSGWKSGYQGITRDTKVIGFEIEVDAWISNSESEISNIVINGIPKTIETLSSPIVATKESNVPFYINGIFADNLGPDQYTITTNLEVQ
ncbi:hypothetical protein LCGC14_0363030 [marine sediment metagenome]|uniref:Uncharacterized protein n=1 Tax=marine sediment metagenome TaxID=412755 RepID=A0A0F9TQ79_9ZZZZ